MTLAAQVPQPDHYTRRHMVVNFMFRRCARLLACWLLASTSWSQAQVVESATSSGLTPVVVQLNWLHQFEYAAFYAAQKQGLYTAAGLDVRLLEGPPGTDVPHRVMAGEADFGVGNSSLLLDRYQGEPVVALAALMQRSPIVLVAKRAAGLERVQDLAGKTVMVPRHAFDEIRAFLKASGLDPNRVTYKPFSHRDFVLRLDQADATEIYISNDGFRAKEQAGQYRIFDPRTVGLEFYGNVLFTRQALLEKSPELVEKFRQATLQGLRYAMDHPESMVDLILTRYNTQGKSREHLLYEAQQLVNLNDQNLVDPGYMSQARWSGIARTFQDLGLIASADVPPGFLYRNDPSLRRLEQLSWALVGVFAALLIMGGVGVYIFTLNRRLKRHMLALNQANADLARMATFDSLTNIPNRSLLNERLQQGIKHCQRNHKQLALLLMDVDKFKAINDTYGHGVGDQVLQAVAQRLQASVRQTDTAARMAGDEFLVLLSEVDSLAAAEQVAQHVRQRVSLPLTVGAHQIDVSLSMGLALYPAHGHDVLSLTRAADMAMYQAKQAHAKGPVTAQAADQPAEPASA